MIDTELLEQYGAQRVALGKSEMLFREGDPARYFFQVVEGEVKMFNYTADGKEFIQGIFSAGRSFGEPPLFGDFTYPASAMALGPTTLLRLPKERFLDLVADQPQWHLELTKALARRLHYKAVMASEHSGNHPESKIMRLLEYLKTEVYGFSEPLSYRTELTRQQIADLTGLRVETVIKAIKRLEQEGRVAIRERKVWL